MKFFTINSFSIFAAELNDHCQSRFDLCKVEKKSRLGEVHLLVSHNGADTTKQDFITYNSLNHHISGFKTSE